MKKKSTIIISTILALSTLLATGCQQGGTGSDGLGGGKNEQFRYTYADAVHDYTAPEIEGEYIVKDGATDFVVVYPADGDNYIKTALDELQIFFKKATGIDLIAVNDSTENSVLTNSNAKRISLGETSVFKSLDETEQDEMYGPKKAQLGTDGIRIVTKDNTIYILGGGSKGVMYGVYDFLQICFNYEYYYRNCIQIDTGVKNLKMRDFNVTDIPDAANRRYTTGTVLKTDCWGFELESGLVTSTDAQRQMYRMRETNGTEEFMQIYKYYDNYNSPWSYGFHSIATFVYPGCKNREGNVIWRENWKSDGGQFGGEWEICYTAHGNQEDYDALVEACADKVIYSLENSALDNKKIFGMTTLDGGMQCTCDACEALKVEDGAYSGAMVRFANKVMEKVQDWKEYNDKADRELLCYIFAYGPHEKPPVKQNSKGEYIAANEHVICRDDVGIFLCMPTTRTTIYRQEEGEDFTTRWPYVDQWAKCAKTMYNWLYVGRFQNYSAFRDDFNTSGPDYYAYLFSKGSTYIMNQTDWMSDTMTSFNVLKDYTCSRLMWDCSLDIVTLVKNYFNAMYKDAADTMYEIFNMMRAHDHTISQVDTSVYGEATKAEYYPYHGYLLPLINKFELALTEIEDLKITNPGEYELVRKRIETEYVGPLYLTLKHYANTSPLSPLDTATTLLYKQKLVDITSAIGFSVSELDPANGMKDVAMAI